MAYNKAKEERKWLLWKETEEKQLRSLEVSEDVIQRLRIQETGTYLEEIAEAELPTEIKTVADFLDNIENQELFQVLITVDKPTLQIVLMKIQGYSTREIAAHLGLTVKAVYRKLDRLKEKIKKFNM